MKRKIKRLLIFLFIFVVFIYLNNTSFFLQNSQKDSLLLAHRGMAQTFPMEGITGETCTAKIIYEPEHAFIENTISSMEAAFEAGADIVELDVHPTTDGEFAVFHDWTLECRTDGEGVTRDHTMEQLKQLDVGYGYTADNGETFPLRGQGVGMMPTLDEVLTYFPTQNFLIHIKSNDSEEGVQLAEYLSKYSNDRVKELTVYGGDAPIATLKETLPELRVMSKETLKSCALPYLGVGWTGYVPEACKNTQLHIPEKFAPLFWGYPAKFMSRMEKVKTRVVLVAGDGDWSEGFDQEVDIERIPEKFDGIIWTNRVDVIAPLFKE
ncbi:glycerophosphodiester phosphodiesterase family protein [Bacillus carboniphilus]|uniref:Glycerophosphodiester phosphodiesterase family protein n=1 Tax=Bacillus carboniphilus TaxID=86663 RepID=A0ABP3GFD7_9BACI